MSDAGSVPTNLISVALTAVLGVLNRRPLICAVPQDGVRVQKKRQLWSLGGDLRRFHLPAGRSTVDGDHTKKGKRAVRDPNMTFCQMVRDIRHELRGGHAAANLTLNLYQHLFDSMINEVLRHRLMSLFTQ